MTRNGSPSSPQRSFSLSCSACCHDLDRGLKTCIPGDAEHGEALGEFVVERRGELIIPRPEAIAVDRIISLHDKKGGGVFGIAGGITRSLFFVNRACGPSCLAVLLKAADTLHTDNTRISELGTNPARLEGLEQTKYLFRQCVSGWRVDGKKIIVSGLPRIIGPMGGVAQGPKLLDGEGMGRDRCSFRSFGFPHKLEFDNDDHLLRREAAKETSPGFPGMDHYHEGDAGLLGGRGVETQALEQQVLGNRTSLLVGPSGVGKSSVLHAGLVPRIRSLTNWGTVVTRPDKMTGAFFTAADFRHVVDGRLAPTRVLLTCANGQWRSIHGYWWRWTSSRTSPTSVRSTSRPLHRPCWTPWADTAMCDC